MTLNPLRRKISEGGVPLGTIVFSGNSHITEMLACLGYDFIVIDAEHTFTSPENMLAQVRAVQVCPGCTPVLRVPGHDPDALKGVMDFLGVDNLMFPLVQSADEARALVSACTYPRKGIRGYAGTTRLTRFGTLKDYAATANDRQCLIAQIESEEAMKRILDIGRVPGIHALFIGLGDLAQEMGVPRGMADPEFREYVGRAVAECAAHGISVGSFQFSLDGARYFREIGGNIISLGSDLRYVADNAKHDLTALLAAAGH